MARERFQEGWVEELGKRVKKWRGHYFVYVRDSTGCEARKHRVVTLGLRSEMRRREAEQKLRAYIIEVLGQDTSKSENPLTLAQFWATRFLPLQTRWRDSTRVVLTNIVTKHLLGKFGDTRLRDLKRFELQTHLNELATRFSKSLVDKVKTWARAILEEAIEQEYIVKNPAARLVLPRTRDTCKRFLTVQEYHDMLGALSGRDNLIFRMFVLCAFRPGELFALRWRCFTGDSLRVEESVFQGKVGQPKTRASTALVVVPKSIAEDLIGWYEQCTGPDPDTLIFPSSAQTPISASNYLRRDVLRPAAISVGIKDIIFQCLRRTFATHFHRIGTVKDQQTQMRHSNAQTTMNIYTQSVPDSLRAAIENFDLKMRTDLNTNEHKPRSRRPASD